MSPLRNSASAYGHVTKALHWFVFLLFTNQVLAAALMLNAGDDGEAWGISQDTWYEWHKSVGVVVFVLALVRYAWRRATPLPEWAPMLSATEKRCIHLIERTLYICMVLMPVSGYVFVMAGGYPLNFFWLGPFPDLIGKHATLSTVGERVHSATAMVTGLALLAHWTLIAVHQRRHRDGYLQRMLPGA